MHVKQMASRAESCYLAQTDTNWASTGADFASQTLKLWGCEASAGSSLRLNFLVTELMFAITRSATALPAHIADMVD